MEKLEKALEKARRLRAKAPPEHTGKMVEALPPGDVELNEARLEMNRIVAYRTRSAEADLFRILRAQVLQSMSQSDFKTLAITSPNYGDGKTTIALNLAISIALDLKQTVLLVDLDLRKASMHSYLGITPAHGLTDYLLRNTPLPECLVRLPFERLSILPAGSQLENSSETLGSPKMAALADELRSRYPNRLIIYDMPPILAQDDPIAFLPHVDAVLLVVQDGVSKTTDIERSLDALENATVIGTVLNDIRI